MTDPHADDYCVVCGQRPEPDGPVMHPVASISDGCVCEECVDRTYPQPDSDESRGSYGGYQP